jgi:NADH-quinone oxidoreductase subunit J
MTSLQMVFILGAIIILGSAIMVVTSRKMFHSALWLITSLFGVAILFALLEASFFVVVQVVVYIGAIAILIIFAVMLTRRMMGDAEPQVNRYWWAAGLASLTVFVGLLAILSGWSGFRQPLPEYSNPGEMITRLGQALVSPNAYVLPFEIASVLLLAALIGSIFIAGEKR